MLYGGGALLVREASVRWGKGWATVLLLGAAYGIVEEGLAVHTFFQPGGAPVNALAEFGRWAGVNTVWATGLTVFHALYSIALPILLVQLAYPESRGRRFLEGRLLPATGVGYAAIVGLFATVTPYIPPPVTIVGTAVVLAALVVAARYVPRDLIALRTGRSRASRTGLYLAGGSTFVLWLVIATGPALFPSPAEAIGLFAAGNLAVLVYVTRFVGTERLPLSEYRFSVGALSVLVAWDVILGAAGVLGIVLVAAAVVAFLYRVGRSVGTARPGALARNLGDDPSSPLGGS